MPPVSSKCLFLMHILVQIGLQGRVMRVWEWDGELREGSLLDTRLFKLDLWENEIRLGKGWKHGEWRLSF
jgi:hypothetical protein